MNHGLVLIDGGNDPPAGLVSGNSEVEVGGRVLQQLRTDNVVAEVYLKSVVILDGNVISINIISQLLGNDFVFFHINVTKRAVCFNCDNDDDNMF